MVNVNHYFYREISLVADKNKKNVKILAYFACKTHSSSVFFLIYIFKYKQTKSLLT